MSKSKFADSLQGLTGEQFDRVAADFMAEAARRGNTSDDWSRVGAMSDNQFNEFFNNACKETKAAEGAKELERAAAASGKTLVDPRAEAAKLDEFIESEGASNNAD